MTRRSPVAGRVPVVHAAFHRADRLLRLPLHAVDHAADVSGRTARAFGQLAYFVGHHGEAATGFAGACGFDRRIQCQQIGLFGHFLDQRRDAANVLRALFELTDRIGRQCDRAADALASLTEVCELQPRSVVYALHDLAHRLRARRGGIDFAQLSADRVQDVADRLLHFGGDCTGMQAFLLQRPVRLADFARGAVDQLHDLFEVVDEAVGPLRQHRRFIDASAGAWQPLRQVAAIFRRAAQDARRLFQPLADRLAAAPLQQNRSGQLQCQANAGSQRRR